MSLKFLASQTPAANSPKLRIKFLRKSFLSVAKRYTPRSQSPTLSGTSGASLAEPGALTVTPLEAIAAPSASSALAAGGAQSAQTDHAISDSALPPAGNERREGPPPTVSTSSELEAQVGGGALLATPPPEAWSISAVSLSQVLTLGLARPVGIGASSPRKLQGGVSPRKFSSG